MRRQAILQAEGNKANERWSGNCVFGEYGGEEAQAGMAGLPGPALALTPQQKENLILERGGGFLGPGKSRTETQNYKRPHLHLCCHLP